MKKNISRRIISCLLVISLCLCCFVTMFSSAEEVQDSTVQSYKEQIAALEAKQQEAQAKIAEAKSNIESTTEYKAAVDETIGYTTQKINTAQAMIDQLNADIEKKNKEIAETEELIKQQKEALLKRLAASQIQGTASYLELLFGAEDLSDFLGKVDCVNAMMEYDKRVIAELKASKEKIKQAQKEIEESLALQQETVSTLQADKEYYATLSAQSQESIYQLVQDEQKYEEEYQAAAAASAALDSELTAYLAELQKQTNRVYVGGDFMWPVPVNGTYISSHYGWRTLNGVSEWHPATDIAAATGTNIYASNGGEVLRSEYHDSYGNYVLIDHGNGMATLYAHMSVSYVSAGQTVSQGDVIGLVGNTGYSFGSHLHFEFRLNGERVDAEAYVPAPY